MTAILYHINSAQCKTIKQKLLDCKISFEEETDINRIIENQIEQVPCLVLNGEKLLYFQALEKLLKIKKGENNDYSN